MELSAFRDPDYIATASLDPVCLGAVEIGAPLPVRCVQGYILDSDGNYFVDSDGRPVGWT